MFKLNFKIALRNLWRNRTYSLINIGGLAIGHSSCLLLLLYADYELLTGGLTLVIAGATVSWQIYAAAKADPVKALKYE